MAVQDDATVAAKRAAVIKAREVALQAKADAVRAKSRAKAEAIRHKAEEKATRTLAKGEAHAARTLDALEARGLHLAAVTACAGWSPPMAVG